MFRWNSGRCMTCKGYIDRVYGMARRKNELDWFRRQCESPDALTLLINNFRNAEALYTAGESSTKWSLMNYKETIETSLLVDIRQRGAMLNEQQYIQFATAMERDHPISHAEARKNWATWSADPKASGLMHQTDDGVLKFRIIQGTDVDNVSQLKLAKSIELLGKSKKNANLEDVEASCRADVKSRVRTPVDKRERERVSERATERVSHTKKLGKPKKI